MAFTEQLEQFFAVEDFAVTATWTPSTGGAQQTAKVLFDSPDQTVFGDAVMTTEYAFTLRTIDFLGLKGGETVNVNGINYKVREVRLLDDGALKHVNLSKA